MLEFRPGAFQFAPASTIPRENARAEINPIDSGHPSTHLVAFVFGSKKKQRIERVMRDNIAFIGRSLRNMGIQDADIDDAVQRTFIIAAERLSDIKPGAERSFLFQTALRVASHARRSVARRTALAQARASEPPPPVETPEEIVGRKRQRLLLDDALQELDQNLRAVFVLYEVEQLTMAEVADMMEIPAGTVASRLRRARQAFQQQVQKLSQQPEARTA